MSSRLSSSGLRSRLTSVTLRVPVCLAFFAPASSSGGNSNNFSPRSMRLSSSWTCRASSTEIFNRWASSSTVIFYLLSEVGAKAPIRSRHLEESLSLVVNTDKASSLYHLTDNRADTLVGQVGNLRHRLNQLRDGEKLVRGHAHVSENRGLEAIIGELGRGRLLFGAVLLRQQFEFVVDEIHESLVGLDFVHLEQSGEAILLSHLSSHSINSFLVFQCVLHLMNLLYHKSFDLSIPS